MSVGLFYKINYPKKEKSLSDELKYKLGKRIYDHDGTLSGEERVLGGDDIGYLQGLADAGVKDADKLIRAIERAEETNGEVVISIHE